MRKSAMVLFIVIWLLPASAAFAFDPLFDVRIDYGAGDGPSSVFAADLDGDGDNDLALANSNSDNVSVLKNNGNGTFQAAVNYGVGYSPWSVFASDLDGDGDNDLAVANEYSDNVSVLKNNGNGTFAAAVNYGAGDGPRSVFAADLDGDGDNDLAVANSNSDNVSILLNRTIHVSINNEPALFPMEYQLSQNYPNPFNSQTNIHYFLPEESAISIEIYDILGRKIETLAEGMEPAGEHRLLWDANDQSSGIYFYRLTVDKHRDTKRMLLLK